MQRGSKREFRICDWNLWDMDQWLWDLRSAGMKERRKFQKYSKKFHCKNFREHLKLYCIPKCNKITIWSLDKESIEFSGYWNLN